MKATFDSFINLANGHTIESQRKSDFGLLWRYEAFKLVKINDKRLKTYKDINKMLYNSFTTIL